MGTVKSFVLPEALWVLVNCKLVRPNPHYEGNDLGYMINNDRFIIGTLDHWDFGDDNTGDLMRQENLAKLIDRSSQLGEVDLVTSDVISEVSKTSYGSTLAWTLLCWGLRAGEPGQLWCV